MLEVKKKVWIYWRNRESSYAYANRKVLIEAPRSIGSADKGVSMMIANHQEQKELMKTIVNDSPNSPTWDKSVRNYWDSLRYEVPSSGKELDLTFVYDISDTSKIPFINAINDNIKSEKAKLLTDKDLKEYVDSRLRNVEIEFARKIASLSDITNEKQRYTVQADAYRVKFDSIFKIEADRYKVGTPTTPFEYMLYKYCLTYSQVANTFELVTKSPNIRFYLHSEEDVVAFKNTQSKKNRNRMSVYRKVIADIITVENVLYAMGQGNSMPSDDNDKLILLEELSKSDTDRFISIADNSKLKTIALIEQYITFGILKKIEGTSIIVDGVDSSITVGDNIDGAIKYFTNKNNISIVDKYKDRYKGLPK